MKITVITTVAQHSKGAELHINNLRWALGSDARIVVNCFAEHRLPDLPVEYNIVHADPKEFYFFWDHIYDVFNDEADLYIFTEQDIICTETIDMNKIDLDSISISFDSYYLSIFDKCNVKLYPRIWEGYSKIPGWMVRRALSDNISLGNHVSRKWYTNDLYTWYGKFISLDSYINDNNGLHEGDIDTLFEFSFYCYMNSFKWHSNNILDYHIATDVVHLRGMDRLCHDCPDIYDNLRSVIVKLEDDNKILRGVYNDMISDCAIMLLLSGVHEESELLYRLMINDQSRHRSLLKLEQIRHRAHEWMDDKQLHSLNMAWLLLSSLESKEVLVC